MPVYKLTCYYCKNEFERTEKCRYKRSFCSKYCQDKQCGLDRSDEYTPFRSKYYTTRRDAERKGIEFNIELKDMKEKFDIQEGICKLSGLPIYLGNDEYERKHGYSTASLDRIDNNQGYTPENIQWLYQDINIDFKKDREEDKMIWFVRQIYEKTKDREIIFKPEWLNKSGKTGLTNPSAPCYNEEATASETPF